MLGGLAPVPHALHPAGKLGQHMADLGHRQVEVAEKGDRKRTSLQARSVRTFTTLSLRIFSVRFLAVRSSTFASASSEGVYRVLNSRISTHFRPGSRTAPRQADRQFEGTAGPLRRKKPSMVVKPDDRPVAVHPPSCLALIIRAAEQPP